jgi:hypothetical protein
VSGPPFWLYEDTCKGLKMPFEHKTPGEGHNLRDEDNASRGRRGPSPDEHVSEV